MVLMEMSDIRLHKNKVGGYAYNDANTLLTQIEKVLKRNLFEDSFDVMKGLTSGISNTLNRYKSKINTNKGDVLETSRAATNFVRTNNITVDP